ncbi:MAG: DUF192 domain-containing protein [Thermodesulfobacteriota bacterium]
MVRRIETIIFVLFLVWISIAHSQGFLKIPLYIKNREIRVEVAKTPEEKNHGLMDRKDLGKDEGMFFVLRI